MVNAGAWTHYSYAIHDALEFAGLPAVEVHLSDVQAREEWRRHSVLGRACIEVVSGKGAEGYRDALAALKAELAHEHPAGAVRASRLIVVRSASCEALLVSGLVNMRWLTGFTGSNAAALVGRGQRRFVTDFRYLTQAAEQLDDGVGARDRPRPARARRRAAAGRRRAAAPGLRRRATVGQGARAPGGAAAGRGRARRRPAGSSRSCAQSRTRASSTRSAPPPGSRTRRWRRCSPPGWRGAPSATSPWRSRSPCAAAAPRRPRSRRSSPRARTARCPTPAARRRDPARHALVVDWGAQLDGYASDCTRTFATGELDARGSRGLRARRARPGGGAGGGAPRDRPVARWTRSPAAIIEAAGHAEHFGHGLGHGVGMEVHEGPRLSKLGEIGCRPAMSSRSSPASTCRVRSACASRTSSW